MPSGDPVRVVVFDPRASSRSELVRALEGGGDVTVVSQCTSSEEALAAVRSLQPDVVALASGSHAAVTPTIERIMAFAPTPILVLQGAREGADDEQRELQAGAVAVLARPADGRWDASALRHKVRMLQRVTVVRHPRGRLRGEAPDPSRPRPGDAPVMVGMAASTGGPHSLVEVVGGLASIDVPVLIVQHIHPEFVEGFADWIGRATGARVGLAEHGAIPEPGVFHIAPAGLHLKVTRTHRIALDPRPAALHRPSANELFRSMADSLGRAAVGVLLTGMGDDGATGLLAIRRAGGTTIVQDGESSAIDGMPRAAREMGAAAVVAPLRQIASAAMTAAGAQR